MKLTKRLNYTVVVSLLLTYTVDSSAQSLDLQECYRKAENLSPIKQQEVYIQSIQELNDQITTNRYLPDVSVKGSATYQSDVFQLPFELPSTPTPEIPKDQYQVTLNLTQNIYSGGAIKAAQDIQQATSAVKSSELSVSLYQIRSVINELYFGILSLQNAESVYQEVLKELSNRERSIQSAVNNGVLLPTANHQIKKEQLKTQQALNASILRKQALLDVMSDWIGEPLGVADRLSLPDFSQNPENELHRPELDVFTNKSNQIAASKSQVKSQLRPKIMAFANVGYGSPNALNFFETSWSSYYMIGGRVEWKFWDWTSSSKQQQVLRLNEEIVQSEKENFTRSVRIN